MEPDNAPGPSLVNPKELGSSQGESLDNVSGKPTSRLTATVGSGASKKEWVDDLADFMQPMLGSKGGPSLVQKAEHSDGTVVIDTLRTATFGEGPNMALEDLFRLGPWLAGLAVELEDVRKLRAMQDKTSTRETPSRLTAECQDLRRAHLCRERTEISGAGGALGAGAIGAKSTMSSH